MPKSKLLLGFTVANKYYDYGQIGDITRSNDGLSDITVNNMQINNLCGATNVHSFVDAEGELRVLAAQYTQNAGDSPLAAIIKLYNPATNPWSPAGAMTWPAINTLHDAVAAGSYIHTIDHDSGTIASHNMTGTACSEAGIIKFPAYFNAIEGPGRPPLAPAGLQHNGVALLKAGQFLLALFTTVDDPGGTAVYQASTVVKLRIDPTTGALSYTAGDYVKVGKNALALEPFAFTFNNTVYNNIYIPCLGGPQHFGSHNPDSRLDIVNLSAMTARTVFQAGLANGPSDQFDFRDLVIGNRGDVYILTGNCNADYATFRGQVYKTTAAVLQMQSNFAVTPALLSQLAEAVDVMTDAPGFFWALLYENALPAINDRFWFVRGNQIDIYSPPPASRNDTPCRTLTPATDLGLVNIDAVTPLWEPPLTRSIPYRGARTPVAQARLARQAAAAAGKARCELRKGL